MKYIQHSSFIIACCAWLLPISSVAQSPRAFEEAAVSAYESKDYYAAFKYYGKVLEMEPERMDIAARYADAARLYGAYRDAEQHYEIVLAAEQSGTWYHSALYGLAEVKKHLSKYEEALRLFERYASRPDSDPELRQKAAAEILECEWAMEKMTNPDVSMELVALGAAYNTGDSEMGMVTRGDTAYFAALKSVNWGDKHYPARPLLQIFRIVGDEKIPVLADFNQPKQHTALPAFSPDGQWMIIPIGNYVSDTDIQCKLFYSRKDAKTGQWSLPTPLPASVNVPNATITQPCIAPKGDGYFDLYYISNAPGGKGGKDIWQVSLAATGNVGTPVNLAVNTTLDEATPYYDTRTAILYFSSNGYQNLGGFDVYKSKWDTKKETWGTVKHLPVPLNGGYNDLYYVPMNDTFSLITTNRIGAAVSAEESCCYDLFSIKTNPIALEASVFEAGSERPLDEVVFSLLAERDPPFTKFSGAKNSYHFNVKKEKYYTVLASKEGYFPDTVLVSTIDLEPKTRLLHAQLHLRPMNVDLAVEVFDDLTKEKLVGVQIRLYERSGRVTDERNTGNTNKSNLLVQYRQEYVIIAQKDGFSMDTAVVSAEEMSRPGTKVIKNMFLTPSSLYGLLPLTIYFDNDMPPRKTDERIEAYDQTVLDYMNRRQEFIRQFTMHMKSDVEKEVAAERLNRFFDDNVQGGMMKLEHLAEELDLFLMGGYSVEIMVRGFASPLASEEYNVALTKRRIMIVLNYLRNAKGGVYQSFILSKQLTITTAPMGESEAIPGISDSPKQRDQSIFSPEASLERRAEILEVRLSRR
jgi:tetratricopeptide (TPR) repeat protein